MAAAKEAQTILVEPLPNESDTYVGRLTVLFESPEAGSLVVTYLQKAGPKSNPLDPKPGDPVKVLGPQQVQFTPDAPTPLRFVFELPAGKPATWLDGYLLLSTAPNKKAGKAKPLTLTVSAQFQPLQELTFEPTSLALQATKGAKDGPSAEVEIDGPAARSLLERKPPLTVRTLLAGDDGESVEATLKNFRDEEGAVRATVGVGESPDPGEYKGSLTLGAGKDAPSLALTVKSHLCYLWFFLLVLVSAIAGGLLPLLMKVSRRRRLTRASLSDAIKRYEKARKKTGFVPNLPWDLDERMGPKPWLKQQWSATSRGYGNLYARLRWARSEDDLDGFSEEVVKAVENISFWLELYEPALLLHKLNGEQGPPRGEKAWAQTQVAEDTDVLLQELRTKPPATAEEAESYKRRCKEQAVWHHNVIDAWTKVTKAQENQDLPKDVRAKLAALDFAPVLSAKPEPEKTSAEAAEARAALVAIAGEARAAAGGDLPQLLIEKSKVPYRELLKATVGAPQEQISEEAESTFRQIYLEDLVLTGVLAGGTVLAYTAPLYDATWGSTEDLLVALGAGFGTTLAIQWAALPLFQSLRFNKAAGNAEEPPKKDAAPAADETNPEQPPAEGDPNAAPEAKRE